MKIIYICIFFHVCLYMHILFCCNISFQYIVLYIGFVLIFFWYTKRRSMMLNKYKIQIPGNHETHQKVCGWKFSVFLNLYKVSFTVYCILHIFFLVGMACVKFLLFRKTAYGKVIYAYILCESQTFLVIKVLSITLKFGNGVLSKGHSIIKY